MDKIACPNGHSQTFTPGPTFTTLVFFQPRYDANLKLVNAHEDPNTSTTELTCDVCGASFLLKKRGGRVWTEPIDRGESADRTEPERGA
jgi:hypothetical protein